MKYIAITSILFIFTSNYCVLYCDEDDNNKNSTKVNVLIKLDKSEYLFDDTGIASVEIHNDGIDDVLVYMPGLSGHANYIPSRLDMCFPSAASPFSWGRIADNDDKLNYVKLTPGEYYGQKYSWKPYLIGTIIFKFRYIYNGNNAKAWKGGVAGIAKVNVTSNKDTIKKRITLLNEKDINARLIAVAQLGLLGDPIAIKPIYTLMKTETDFAVLRNASYALYQIATQIGAEFPGIPGNVMNYNNEIHLPLVKSWAEKYLSSNPEMNK
jgi:hypothetical protein